MFKNTFKALTTFTILLGCYFGYVRAFGWVVDQFRSSNSSTKIFFQTHPSNSKLQAAALAEEVLGANHWSVVNKLPYAFYNAERRFWMYTLNFEEIKEENGVNYEGKRQRMQPFAMIFKSNDGKSNQVLTSDVATLDMNQPLGLTSKPDSEPLKLQHAVCEGNVWIRDDRGTPKDPRDDMNIGPLRHVEYDEGLQQITTDDHVVIQDPDTLISGDGMLIQLRTKTAEERAQKPNDKAGFGGADYVIFRKNVHVFMRNVGDSGILPGPSTSGKPKSATVAASPGAAGGVSEPVPLDIVCDGEMRIDMAEDPEAVLVGPPAPPEPTRVRFNLNVVAARGQMDRGPDKLLCDTLDLTLIPGDKPPPAAGGGTAIVANPQPKVGPVASSTVADPPAPSDAAGGTATAAAAGATATDTTAATTKASAPAPAAAAKGGSLFGNLTLKRAHATGHAVWLYIPASGMKLRCNELIHDRRAPFESDRTYVRGDVTRRVWIEKIDTVEDEGPDKGKVASITHIWTDDATMFDSGGGMDKSNIRTRGPGRMETRSDRDPPYERIAIWQKELNVYNVLSPDGEIQTKLIWLEGNHPQFIDKLQNVSIDSGESIKLWMKPRPAITATASVDAGNAMAAPAVATEATADSRPNGSSGDPTGGGFRIEKLVAIRNVHLLAPNRKMTARERLDADFIEIEPAAAAAKNENEVVAANEDVAPAQPPAAADSGAAPVVAQGAAPAVAQGAAPVVAQNAAQPNAAQGQPDPAKPAPAPQQPPALLMTGIGDRVWAKVAMQPDAAKPKKEPNSPAPAQATPASNEPAANAEPLASAGESTPVAAKPAATAGPATEVRELWMWGTVAIHQDPAPDKKKGEDASGQALYLLNRGEGRALTKIFQRDPNVPANRPARLPLARVTTDDMDITGKIIQMDQEVDKIWVDGEGTLQQLTDRSAFTDKSAKTTEAPETNVKPEPEPAIAVAARDDAREKRTAAGQTTMRSTHKVGRNDQVASEPTPKPKPKMRAGVPVSDTELMTITWTERMEFDGRTTDPYGHPAARADFYGVVHTLMTDSTLHCEQKMIAFTDKEVPLAQLGSMSKPKPQGNDGQENEKPAEEPEPQAQLALIYCYGKPYAITRTIDENQPITLEKKRINAVDRLDYDRRSGNFFVPGAGQVFLYDRDKNKNASPGTPQATDDTDVKNSPATAPTTRGRSVTPTSGRAPNRSATTNVSAPSTRGVKLEKLADRPVVPPLILTQIKFAKEMRGRFGSGQQNDTTENRWSEFFGDVQVRRGEIADENKEFSFDSQLRTDDFFMTSQVLRVISEPAPVGSPPNTPARTFMKGWEKAMTRTIDKVIKSDVITYDSNNDQMHAYGEEGRPVLMAQQMGNGQPSSSTRARAVVFNPKTGAFHTFDNSGVVLVEEAGARPSLLPPPDPNAKLPKKTKPMFRINNGNLERRGFTGS